MTVTFIAFVVTQVLVGVGCIALAQLSDDWSVVAMFAWPILSLFALTAVLLPAG